MNRLKKIFKLLIMWISSIIYHNHKSKILYYHDIYLEYSYKSLDSDILMGTSLDIFNKHLEVIKKEGYSVVPKISKPDGEVAIMLDDGFRGIWDNRQFFYDHNIFPTVFLAVDLIGEEGFLKKNEIIELQQHGFNFEGHSWSHVDLTKCSDDELKHELIDSKRYLSELLGKEVTDICLPLGFFSDHLVELIKEAGYTVAYSSVPGNYYETVCGCLKTRNLLQFASPRELKLILRGGTSILHNHYIKMYHK